MPINLSTNENVTVNGTSALVEELESLSSTDFTRDAETNPILGAPTKIRATAAAKEYFSTKNTINKIAEKYKINVATLYKYVYEEKMKNPNLVLRREVSAANAVYMRSMITLGIGLSPVQIMNKKTKADKKFLRLFKSVFPDKYKELIKMKG